jgi:hypothetical protein
VTSGTQHRSKLCLERRTESRIGHPAGATAIKAQTKHHGNVVQNRDIQEMVSADHIGSSFCYPP